MFKFVNNDANNPTGKRKQSQRACETCRKRKKRCHHNDPEATENATQVIGNASFSQILSSSPTDDVHETLTDHHSMPEVKGLPHSPSTWIGGPQTATTDRVEPNLNRAYGPDTASPSLNSRFVGDLNPEGIFLAAASPDTTRDVSSTEGVGVWLAKALNDKELQPASELPGLFNGSGSVLPKVLIPILQEEVLSTMPPPPHASALSTLYFEKMHPILPVIDQNLLQTLPTEDPRRVLLLQGVCLAASKSFTLNQHLILHGSSSILTSREFGSRILAAMRLIIEMGLVTDKIVLIQALAIMSHFADGPENGNVASQHLSRAIQHAFSLGLHVQGHRQRDADQNIITLFCSLWALDRMNAAFHGRPVTIHDRDVGRNLEQCSETQQPVFRLLLEITSLLDKVIGLYRPSNSLEDLSLKFEFPSFEELVMRCAQSHVATSLLGTSKLSEIGTSSGKTSSNSV